MKYVLVINQRKSSWGGKNDCSTSKCVINLKLMAQFGFSGDQADNKIHHGKLPGQKLTFLWCKRVLFASASHKRKSEWLVHL